VEHKKQEREHAKSRGTKRSRQSPCHQHLLRWTSHSITHLPESPASTPRPTTHPRSRMSDATPGRHDTVPPFCTDPTQRTVQNIGLGRQCPRVVGRQGAHRVLIDVVNEPGRIIKDCVPRLDGPKQGDGTSVVPHRGKQAAKGGEDRETKDEPKAKRSQPNHPHPCSLLSSSMPHAASPIALTPPLLSWLLSARPHPQPGSSPSVRPKKIRISSKASKTTSADERRAPRPGAESRPPKTATRRATAGWRAPPKCRAAAARRRQTPRTS